MWLNFNLLRAYLIFIRENKISMFNSTNSFVYSVTMAMTFEDWLLLVFVSFHSSVYDMLKQVQIATNNNEYIYDIHIDP